MEEAFINCPKCTAQNSEKNRSCSRCGELFDFTTPLNTPPPLLCSLADLNLNPGDSFGSRYQIVEQIGSGGMSRVFKALDKELNIQVVLKIIDPELSKSPEAVERFKRELLLAREIIHENVIRIHDLGEADGIRYISMNHVEGRNLQELIDMAGPLSLAKVLDIIGKICRALVTAHGKGIIHRDLKPQNVMIGKDGKVTVLDFGIARSLDQVGTTRTGIIIGTPECMAPEQIQGEKVDASTDIYSLGVMMYQMVTGRVPFTADNMQSLLFKHLHQAPTAPSALNPAVPRSLERIILKCMEKRPDKRYATAEKLLKRIDRLLKREARYENLKGKLFFLRRPLRLRPLIFFGRFLELIVLLFALATLLGWAVDYHYGNKLQALSMEYFHYFKARFPMDKDYLPADRPARQGDAWKAYRQVMQAQTALHPAAGRRLNREMKKLYGAAITPIDLDMVKLTLDNAGSKFKLDRLSAGVANTFLAPGPGAALSPDFVATSGRWQALKARSAFLAGDTAAGVERLRELGSFLLDAETGAAAMDEYVQAVGLFRVFCQELVPLALAHDIDPAAKQLDKLEPLLLLFLKRMNSRRFFQTAYLDDLQWLRRADFSDDWWSGPAYFWFGRIRMLSQKSTRNLYLYRTLAAESQGRDALAVVSRPADINEVLARFRRDDGRDWPRVGSAAFYSLHDSLRAGRTLVKLALLIGRLQRFGVNDNQVVALLVSDLGINELSNEPWKIVQRDEKNIVRLTERGEFAIRPIAYASGHAAVIAELENIAVAIGATKIF